MGEQIEIASEVNLRILEVVSRLKQEVDDLYEELEMLMNKKMWKTWKGAGKRCKRVNYTIGTNLRS